MTDGWNDIASAPRNGRPIRVAAFDDHGLIQSFVMQWGHIARNELFAPGVVGMWVAPDGSFTWDASHDGGPTHWRELS